MSLDSLKKYMQDTAKHSESKIKRSRSMLKLLESRGFSSTEKIEKFVGEVEVEIEHEEISNIFSTKLNADYAHSTARDLFNCLKSMITEFNALPENSNEAEIDNKPAIDINVAQVITLAEELDKNLKNPNIDQHLKDDINKLILRKMQNIIEAQI